MSDPGVVVGRIGRPHGVRGAVHAEPTGPTLATLAPGERVEVEVPGGEPPRPLVLAARDGRPERPILSFEDVVSREQAAALRGGWIRVPAGRIAPLEEGTYFVRDLLGCEVLIGERPIGPVAEVHPGPANDVLEVAAAAGPLLVPFTADVIVALDLDARRIVVRPGLLEA